MILGVNFVEGIFLRKNRNTVLFCLFACGSLLIGLYIFLLIEDPEAPQGILSFLIEGVLLCVCVTFSWLFNAGAYIRVDALHIEAKYHWFGKLHCSLADIAYAGAKINTLDIILKNGKIYSVVGLQNNWQLAAYLRKYIPFSVTEQPDTLRQKRDKMISCRKKWLMYTCLGVAMMFALVLSTVLLTDGKDTNAFSDGDWLVFRFMGAVGVVNLIAILLLANRAGKCNLPIENLQYRLRRTIVETALLPPGKVMKVFSDEDYQGRLIVYGYPQDASVYYIIQKLAPDDTLRITCESGVYKSIEELLGSLDSLTNITDRVLH